MDMNFSFSSWSAGVSVTDAGHNMSFDTVPLWEFVKKILQCDLSICHQVFIFLCSDDRCKEGECMGNVMLLLLTLGIMSCPREVCYTALWVDCAPRFWRGCNFFVVFCFKSPILLIKKKKKSEIWWCTELHELY